MRTRDKVKMMLRDIEENGTEYTITNKKGEPLAVIIPVEKLAKLRADLLNAEAERDDDV